ncbi:MAG: hypothetical protein INR69_05390 [Mucilaginibacter polytrichastri]|nr:hypothetical protein [Mucilaginibacter polytrichastri]
MNQHAKKRFLRFPCKSSLAVCTILGVVILLASSFNEEKRIVNKGIKPVLAAKDSVASVKAFSDVYKVLMSPRCKNCHPSGDVPLQGDESRLHTMLPKRGKDGKGVYAMKCQNCHQPANTPGLHTPPGNPEWHLPPADMKMVFEGKTPQQLAKQLVDPKQNGNKNMKQLLEHASDGLVKAGWDPGEGRTKPPLAYEEFKKAWYAWIQNGAYAPQP